MGKKERRDLAFSLPIQFCHIPDLTWQGWGGGGKRKDLRGGKNETDSRSSGRPSVSLSARSVCLFLGCSRWRKEEGKKEGKGKRKMRLTTRPLDLLYLFARMLVSAIASTGGGGKKGKKRKKNHIFERGKGQLTEWRLCPILSRAKYLADHVVSVSSASAAEREKKKEELNIGKREGEQKKKTPPELSEVTLYCL